MSYCGSDDDHCQALWWKSKQRPSLRDTLFLMSLTYRPPSSSPSCRRRQHMYLSHTFTYDHPLPVPFLERSAICVDTERHASCVRAAELDLAVSRARPRGASTPHIDTGSPLQKGSLPVLPPYPSPPTSLDSPRLTAMLTPVSARAWH